MRDLLGGGEPLDRRELVGDALHPAIDPSLTGGDGDAGLRPEGERLIVQNHWSEAREVPIDSTGSGHGGGDALLLDDVFAGPGDDPLSRPADWSDGIRSIAVGIAGNLSLETGMPVQIADLGIRLLTPRA